MAVFVDKANGLKGSQRDITGLFNREEIDASLSFERNVIRMKLPTENSMIKIPKEQQSNCTN